MSQTANKVVLLKEDYALLTKLFSKAKHLKIKALENYKLLISEISKAILLDKDQFPSDVVRLNSTVIVKDMDTNQVKTYTIVLPDKVNTRQSKVSILSPIGIALIGFKKGLRFTWKFLSSKQRLSIMEVYNSPSLAHSIQPTRLENASTKTGGAPITQFYKLTVEEQKVLYKAPVLISVLASCFCQNHKRENAAAIRSAHLKTFAAPPLLLPYYTEVEKNFSVLFESAIKQYFPFFEPMRITLNREMAGANRVIDKLDQQYAQALHQSLEKYASHVKTPGW